LAEFFPYLKISFFVYSDYMHAQKFMATYLYEIEHRG
jgi:hypothetical protein